MAPNRALALRCLLLLLAASYAGAQAPPRPQGPSPLAGPEHFRLAFLAGQWEEEITYSGRPAGAEKGRGRWQARPELGLYLVLRYEGEGPEGAYRALGLLTWDREAQSYRMWWFDDAGGVGEYRGSFRDENTLVLEHHGKADGNDFRERIIYTRVSPGAVRTRIEQAYGNEDYKPYLEALARRMTPPPGQRPAIPPPLP